MPTDVRRCGAKVAWCCLCLSSLASVCVGSAGILIVREIRETVRQLSKGVGGHDFSAEIGVWNSYATYVTYMTVAVVLALALSAFMSVREIRFKSWLSRVGCVGSGRDGSDGRAHGGIE